MNNKIRLNILVIGTGMYVSGRGTDGYGTIMPAIFEWAKDCNIGKVFLVGTNWKNLSATRRKINSLAKQTGSRLSVEYMPRQGIRSSQCYKEAIKKIPRPVAAIVAVPDNLHREIAGAAISAGLHTLVVKPLASTTKEVYELIRLQQKHKRYCLVEFHKRLDEANLKMRDIINEGKIGDPLYFLIEYSQRKNIPLRHFRKWVQDTNVFQYLGVHYADIIYFATGAIPKRAMAMGQKGYLLSKGIDTYDSIGGVIEWELPSKKKFSSHILTNWIDPESTSAMSDQKIKVIGTKGRFESNQKNRGLKIVTDEKGIEEPNPYFCSAYGQRADVYYRGYGIDSIHQFLNDVVQIEEGAIKIDDLEGKRPTFRQSIVPTAVLEAVNKSLKNKGKWVTVKKV